MRLDRSELSKAVQTALSLGAVAAVGITGTAFAQNATTTQNDQKTPQTLQTIVVTGSHIRRVDLETDNPVVAVTAQQLQATGKLTIGDVIQNLPVMTGGTTNPTVNNGGGSGSTMVGLRGLGPSRTLVLVDGQRVIKNGSGVDLNSIPTAAVERIEVLTSGASAIYGSDAIGGVVNIILKNNYQGAQFQLNYGISDHSDGQREGASFVFGQTSDKGSILAGVSYQKFDSILQSNRKFSKDALTTSGTTNGKPKWIVGGSTYALRDYVSVSGALATKFGCPTTAKAGTLSLNQSAFDGGGMTGPGDYHCFQTADGYNFAAVNYIMTPNERTNAFFKGTYHLTDNIDFYGTYYHNKTSSGAQLAPAVFGTPTQPGVVVSKDSYYNPFGVDFSSTGGNLYRVRLLPGGFRASANGNTTDQLIMGFRGNFNILDRNWQWDVGYNYGHISTVNTITGYPNQVAMVQGLGPSFLNSDGVVQCGTAADPIDLNSCTPWNAFNLNSPSAKAVISGASGASLINTVAIERTYHADINGGLFDLPAGTMQLAAGVSYRKEYTNNVVGPMIVINPNTLTCTLGSGCSAHLQGGYNVKEAYAELFIPILKDLPFAHGLNVTLSDRYSKYSNFGSTSNWKIGLEWRPIDDLLLRGTVAKIFRAPTIGNIFAAPSSSAPVLSADPCDHITTAGNPACVGVPTDGSFVNTNVTTGQQLNAINEGAQTAGFPLGPENGKSFDLGAVYSPNFVPGLSLSVDFWRIYLKNQISLIGVQTVMDQCFAGNTKFCPFIQRVQGGPNSGQLTHMIQPTGNLGRLDVNGVDLAAQYKLPAFSFGQFTVALNATYLSQYKIQTAPGTSGNAVYNGAGAMGYFGTGLQSVCPFSAGGLCFFPRVRAQGNLDWQLGPWSAGWQMRWSSPFRPDGRHGDIENLDRFGSYVYNDLHVGYEIQPINTSLQVGVDNVFDKQPPLFGYTPGLNANTDPQDFDTIGRYYWARMTVKF